MQTFTVKSSILMPKYPLFMLILACLSFSSCKKLIEEREKNLFLQVMTNGHWNIENFREGTIDITSQFSGYNFKFEENGTVVGIHDSVTVNGTWQGDIENYTITSHFPTANDLIKKLNGMWKVIDAEVDFVVAEMNTEKGKMLIRLRKG
jgi:hypothetical protein